MQLTHEHLTMDKWQKQIKLNQYLLSELFLWGRRGVLWSSPPARVGGRGGAPGRPGGRGGAPPPAEGREAGEDEIEEDGLELTEGGGGGTSRGIDGQ